MIIGIPQSTRRNAKYVGDQAKEIKFAYVNESLLEGPVIEAEFSNIIAFGRLRAIKAILQNVRLVRLVHLSFAPLQIHS